MVYGFNKISNRLNYIEGIYQQKTEMFEQLS
jgi:hypothetical protein